MTKFTTVQCADCGSNMIPRTIFRRSVFRGSRSTKVAGSCCPICQSTNWRGDTSSLRDLIAVFNMNPGLAVLLVIVGIPSLIAFLLALLLVLLSTYSAFLAMLAGESFWLTIQKGGAGPAFVGLFGLSVLLAGLAYIPFTYYGLWRKKS